MIVGVQLRRPPNAQLGSVIPFEDYIADIRGLSGDERRKLSEWLCQYNDLLEPGEAIKGVLVPSDGSSLRLVRGMSRKDILLKWQHAIKKQIKLNQMDRLQTAKNILERARRDKVRMQAAAARSRRVEPPLSAAGPSGPAPKSNAGHKETPTAADRAKRESQKCESLQMCDAHRSHQKELERLRVRQNEEKLEALSIAERIQSGD